MKFQIVTIRDVKTDSYSQPQCVVSIGGWLRALADEVNKEGNALSAHPEDYEAYHLGQWDDNSGEFTTHDGESDIHKAHYKSLGAISNFKR